MSGLLCIYNKAEDLDLLSQIKITEKDLFIIYYLIEILEKFKEDENIVENTLNVMLIPIVFALHPENHTLNSKQFMNTMRKLNIGTYEYKIASISNEYKKNKNL